MISNRELWVTSVEAGRSTRDGRPLDERVTAIDGDASVEFGASCGTYHVGDRVLLTVKMDEDPT